MTFITHTSCPDATPLLYGNVSPSARLQPYGWPIFQPASSHIYGPFGNSLTLNFRPPPSATTLHTLLPSTPLLLLSPKGPGLALWGLRPSPSRTSQWIAALLHLVLFIVMYEFVTFAFIAGLSKRPALVSLLANT